MQNETLRITTGAMKSTLIVQCGKINYKIAKTKLPKGYYSNDSKIKIYPYQPSDCCAALKWKSSTHRKGERVGVEVGRTLKNLKKSNKKGNGIIGQNL